MKKKLGILLAASPDSDSFRHATKLAEAALGRGLSVSLYCIDEAVHGVCDPRVAALAGRGLKLFGCAYGARRRGLPLTSEVVWAGLSLASDLAASSDRFVCFGGGRSIQETVT